MNSTCSICMEDFKEEENKNIFKFCNDKHIFCKKCFQEYVNKIHKNNPNMPIYETIPCPYCRNNISAQYLYAIYNKKEGLNITYYKNGQVYEEIYYKDGFIGDGPYKKYYDNGVLRIMHTYKDKRINGLYIENWLNGNPKRRTYYINGLANGISRVYYENGILEKESYYVNDIIEGIHKEYYNNLNIKKICTYANGKKNGLYEEWSNEVEENRKIIKKEFYKNGIEIKYFYFE